MVALRALRTSKNSIFSGSLYLLICLTFSKVIISFMPRNVNLGSTVVKRVTFWVYPKSSKSFAHAASPFVMMGNGFDSFRTPLLSAHTPRDAQNPPKLTTLAGGNPEKGIAALIVSESPENPRWDFFQSPSWRSTVVKMKDSGWIMDDLLCV